MAGVDVLVLVASLAVILAGSQLFTNGVEWVGEGFGLSEGVVGSVLAAVGTALPETILPLVAILLGHAGRESGQEIGIGAILGAPFMLSTLTMFVVGVGTLVAARGGRRPRDLEADGGVIRQDLAFFLPMYALSLVAGLLDVRELDWALAGGLVVAYTIYVRRHLQAPGERELEAEAGGEVAPLYLRAWLLRLRGSVDPSRPVPWQSVAQTVVALGLIVGGARAFVAGISGIAASLGVPALAFALLVAPVATELPEKFNSVLWVRRRKDTLALGNVTGAMVFQASFPVSVGLLLTPWRLDQTGAVSALVALVAAGAVLLTLRLRGRLSAWLLLAQGVLYGGFVVYVVTTRL